MAQQYSNYMSPGIGQVMTPAGYYADYNCPTNYQPQMYYNQQPVQQYQQYQQYQYDPRAYYPIMSNNGGNSNAQQPEQQSQKSNDASSSSLWYCFYQPCASQNKAFKRKADLDRHITAMHTRESAETLDCDYPGCHRRGAYGFVRRDKLIEHQRDVHKINIPKKSRKSP